VHATSQSKGVLESVLVLCRSRRGRVAQTLHAWVQTCVSASTYLAAIWHPSPQRLEFRTCVVHVRSSTMCFASHG
jgi:hypothetical protein